MFLLRRPDRAAIEQFLHRQNEQSFSYAEVGCSRETPPRGYNVDRYRVRLGEGAATYAAASDALRRWEMMRLGWVEPIPALQDLQPGTAVAVLARYRGLWSLNACRIVYQIDEAGSAPRFGFAYGTLANHLERGEERFLVECMPDGSVWYEVLAISRPGHWLARLAYPLVRRLQRRFGAESLAAMARLAAQPQRAIHSL